MNVGDVRIHYLDFGGEGLPIVLLPAGARTADHYKEFGPRFVDRHRVLAITPRGTGESGGRMSAVPTTVRDILAVLDTLGIRRAVMMGNTRPAVEMTYLAEHHPDRVAGLVYFAHGPQFIELDTLDRTGGMRMYIRYLAATMRLSVDAPLELDSYRPAYLQNAKARLTVPALTFVNQDGKTRGLEHFNVLLLTAQQVAREGSGFIPDSLARAYFERLAVDSGLQTQVRTLWADLVPPKTAADAAVFNRAFGDHLQTVRLNVPFVTGYEYSTAPDLLYPHIRLFLEQVSKSP